MISRLSRRLLSPPLLQSHAFSLLKREPNGRIVPRLFSSGGGNNVIVDHQKATSTEKTSSLKASLVDTTSQSIPSNSPIDEDEDDEDDTKNMNMNDHDNGNDFTNDFEANVDIDYEHEQQDKIEWLDEGHFISQDFLFQGDAATAREEITLSSKRPLYVHTNIRGEDGDSIGHDSHPFVALVHLLRNAEEKSNVIISMPFFTDFHALDQICHYAKSIREGGTELEVKVILGPDLSNETEIQRFIGNSEQRYWSVQRVKFRRFGVLANKSTGIKSVLNHSKTIVTTAGAMVGSYNCTYAARFRNGEDGFVVSAETVPQLASEMLAVWELGEDVVFKNPRSASARATTNPFAKRSKINV